jgi:hypothetical protein
MKVFPHASVGRWELFAVLISAPLLAALLLFSSLGKELEATM